MRFEPIYQYRLWGGRRLSNLLSAPLPCDGAIGEAWVLSDRDDYSSQVANGPLKGQTIRQLMEQFQEQLMGKLASRFSRFPLLLKFLDAREMLSVQVHPSDAHPDLIPAGETGKSEAWVVIEAGNKSRVYAGMQPGTTPGDLRVSLTDGTIADRLVVIDPKAGDSVFIPAGTVHTLGGDLMVFEIQQNSDITFRLYDWGRVDQKTRQPRALQIDQAIASIDFAENTGGLITPSIEETMPAKRERLFDCRHFLLWRLRGELPFAVGGEGEPHVLVCIDGSGLIEHGSATYAIDKGDVWLIPAVIGACVCRPNKTVTLLEAALPSA
jgi:mannose-6-phosphate isomerase